MLSRQSSEEIITDAFRLFEASVRIPGEISTLLEAKCPMKEFLVKMRRVGSKGTNLRRIYTATCGLTANDFDISREKESFIFSLLNPSDYSKMHLSSIQVDVIRY